MQHPVGMGRGYPGYGGMPTSAAAAGYGGAAPGAAPGYGYGMICLNTVYTCLLYTSPSPRDRTRSRMPSSA